MNGTEIPPLVVDDLRIDSNGMPVIVLWGNKEASRFFTLAAAKASIVAAGYLKHDSRVQGVRVYEWDGKEWRQKFF